MKYLFFFTSFAAILLLTNPLKWKNNMSVKPKNVLGTELQACSSAPLTGYYRDGSCNTGYEDYGVHVVCAEVTKEFLAYTKKLGNDLSTPLPPPSTFPGLKPGDRWCLCGSRWQEAYEAGYACLLYTSDAADE